MAAIQYSNAATSGAVVAWLPAHRFGEIEAPNLLYCRASASSLGTLRDALLQNPRGVALVDPECLAELHDAARQIAFERGWIVVFHAASTRAASRAVLQWLSWEPAAVLRGKARVDHDSVQYVAERSASRIQLLQRLGPFLRKLPGPVAAAAVDICLGLASAASVTEFGRFAGVAPRSLQRDFREAGLQSPTMFLHAVGVAQLLDDLLHEQGSIETLAEASSLRHRRVLSRWAKRFLGATPSEVRGGRLTRADLVRRIADRLRRQDVSTG
jgi:AraC-like DNA-binding protein